MIGKGKVENITDMLTKRPFYDEYWQDKRNPVERIPADLPVYMTMSYSAGFHT